MTAYIPPLKDMNFLMHHVFGFKDEAVDQDTFTAILDEAAKLARDILAPLNHSGDTQGCAYDAATHSVTTADGFKDAYATYRDGGWNAVPFEEDYGGQGLPWSVVFPVQEMWQGANMSFGLCPLLNQGAVEAITQHGSQTLKDTYLEKLISGQWTGTMNLTEPHAGSDLGLLSAKAEPKGDDSYAISGQKIFITYGEHDLADNIIHLVLARLPDAPDDVKGISLFVVPKFLEDGTRNDVRCIGVEEKIGIHASPTCTMEFDGAIGYIVGEPHQGLKYMFTMMNNARLSVGLQGVALAERSYQHALAYAQERKQGKSFGGTERVTIDHHPDVKRMLLTMKALTDAGRALTYQAAIHLDSKSGLVDLLTPLVKSWCTDMAERVSSIGIQIHGGMGFIEETGAAQYWRDSRILPIYEGTNGIQAADLTFRKILRDNGQQALAYIDDLEQHVNAAHSADFAPHFTDLRALLQTLSQTRNLEDIAFAAKPLLDGFATLAAGAILSHSVNALGQHDDDDFIKEKTQIIDFYIKHILPQTGAYLISAKTVYQQRPKLFRGTSAIIILRVT